LPLRTDLARHARDLGRERPQLIDHAVDDLGRAEELAADAPAVDVHGHLLREVARGDGADDPPDLRGGLYEVGAERVDGLDARAPLPSRVPQRRALRELALLADHLADAVELARHPGRQLYDFVERIDNLSGDPHVPLPHPDREVPLLEVPQRPEKRVRID